MDLSTFSCPQCTEYQSDNLDSLRIHCQKKHKLSSVDLYKKLFLNGEEPRCECGCGQIPRFHSLQVGYMKFMRGHASRIHNNWGHNETARAKSLKKRQDEGLWSRNPWNRGKTKEDDERLLKIGNKISELHGERYSELMRDRRLSGTIPSLSGSSHPNWRGGTSALAPLCRSRIYSSWAYPKLQAAHFKCTQCGADRDLEVHHDRERFSEILQRGIRTLGEPGEDFDRKDCFADWVDWYHREHSVSGVVLCAPCHTHQHVGDPE